MDAAQALAREARLTATIAKLQGELAELAAQLVQRDAEIRRLTVEQVPA